MSTISLSPQKPHTPDMFIDTLSPTLHTEQSELPVDGQYDEALEKQQANSRRSRKGKRNKPTLNCSERVDRKTRCDRARPTCLSCLRRQTVCQYTKVADILAATGGSRPRKKPNRPSAAQESTSSGHASLGIPTNPRRSTWHSPFTIPPLFSTNGASASPASGTSPSIQRDRFTLFPQPFEGKAHPFSNYWTCIGGLSEVVDVLPSKEQADVLVEKYFECVDPLYPIISRHEFTAEHERFWTLPMEEKIDVDAGHLALQFIIYGCGTQFMDNLTPDERVSTAEFYVSASHQALCLFSYLNRSSLPSLQTMILLCHFLVSNNHISDAWTFSGMTQRQAYGLGLNRDPDLVRPEDTFAEKQQRCRLWQATMFQDTGPSLYTELPPGTSYHDVDPACLKSSNGSTDDVQDDSPHHLDGLTFFADFSFGSRRDESSINDVNFLRAMWEYASFAQNHVCIPRALRRALCRDPTHKAQLVSEFRQLYTSWSAPFNSYDPNRFEGWDSRLARQVVAVSSNFFWLLMFLHMDSNDLTGVEKDIYGALDAAHEGLAAFFALVRLRPASASAWCSNHTRAYEQAVMIGTILADEGVSRDPRLMLAHSDLQRYVDTLTRARGSADYETLRKRRLQELESLRVTFKYV